jgi:hypothetical protein
MPEVVPEFLSIARLADADRKRIQPSVDFARQKLSGG